MRTRAKSWRWMLRAALISLLVAAAGFGAVYYQVSTQAQVDEARPADVIVVLGAAQYFGRPSPVLKARLDHALELYNEGLAPRILTTGGQGEGSTFTEGEVSRRYLSENGVPAEFITVEAGGRTTMQSAAAVIEIMDRMEMESCIVVSDAYHIHRVKRMLEEAGLVVYGSPPLPRRGRLDAHQTLRPRVAQLYPLAYRHPRLTRRPLALLPRHDQDAEGHAQHPH